MKVYFGTSPRIKKRYPKTISKIYRLIEESGHTHTSDFVIGVEPDEFYSRSEKEYQEHHWKTLRDIKEADICVFEASLHSLSVGYLMNLSLDLGKPVIVLVREQLRPPVLQSLKSDNLLFVDYNEKTLEKKLKLVLRKAANRLDVRFNFFVTPKILAYLDWLSRKKRIPRAVYLRNLIERDMKYDKDYQGKELS